jgi:hypothetical protein
LSLKYTLAINDFVAAAGGYPVPPLCITTQDFMDQVLADDIAANTPVGPAIQERIVCIGAGW